MSKRRTVSDSQLRLLDLLAEDLDLSASTEKVNARRIPMQTVAACVRAGWVRWLRRGVLVLTEKGIEALTT